MKRWIVWMMGLAVTVLMAGCGGSPTASTGPLSSRAALAEVAEAYRSYIAINGKPPAKLKDLARVQDVAPAGVKLVKAGTVIVRYGAMMADTKEGVAETPSDEVLAWDKVVPESGGDVLMLDRSVKTMTADEFKSAKKAGKD